MATIDFITLYNINKRRNSTKLPTEAEKVCDIVGNFNEASSMFSPTILLNRNMSVSNVSNFNYMKIAWPLSIARYYWVTDKVILPDGRISVSCVEDILATFKTNIFNSYNYIERAFFRGRPVGRDSSASIANALVQPANKNLILDTSVQTKGEYKLSTHNLRQVFSDTKGFYVVGITALEVDFNTFYDQDGTNWVKNDTLLAAYNTPTYYAQLGSTESFSRGGVKYYTMSATDFAVFSNYLLSQRGAFADIDFTQYIASCIYCPVELEETEHQDVNTAFYLGKVGDDQLFLQITYRAKVECPNGQLSIKDKLAIPIDWSLADGYGGTYLAEPYVNVSLLYGPFGEIDVSMRNLLGHNWLNTLTYGMSPYVFANVWRLILDVDLFSGAASLSIVKYDYTIENDNYVIDYNHTGYLRDKEHAVICPSIPIASITSDSRLRAIINEKNLKYAKVTARMSAIGAVAEPAHKASRIAHSLNSGKTTGRKVSAAYSATNDIDFGGGLLGVAGAALSERKARSDYEIASWENALPQANIAGSSGAFLDFEYTDTWSCVVNVKTFEPMFHGLGIYSFAYAREGMPYHIYETLSSHYENNISEDITWVYVKTLNADLVDINGNTLSSNMLESEIAAVCDALDSGIYLE